jgi:hypothetical protein
MKIKQRQLIETINEELKKVAVERYLRQEIAMVLTEQDAPFSTAKVENLLGDVLGALEKIDMSIDYLTAAITGDDPYSIGITQKVVGRGGMISKAKIDEGWADLVGGNEPEAHEDEEEEGDVPELQWPEGSKEDPGALRTDTRLGGDWQGNTNDDEPRPQHPPEEHRREAIKILATFNLKVGQEAIDILAWELYNKAQSATTQSLAAPAGKEGILQKGLKKLGLAEVSKADLGTIRYFTKGLPYEVEAMLIGLVDKHGFTIEDVEVMANELRDLRQGELDPTPQRRIAEKRLREYVEEELQTYLDEVYSKKQRDFMCAMKDAPAGERPESLSKGEADHLCSAPMEKPKKRKAK